MADLNYDVLDMQGKKKDSVSLNPEVFDVEVEPSIVHSVVKWQLAKRRSGTHSTLNVAKKSNTKKKIFQQKGTGRARAGHKYSPTRYGGAVAHGPQPRDYDFKINKKVKKSALAAVLTDKVRASKLVCLESFESKTGKTSDMTKSFDKMGISNAKVLVVLTGAAENREKEMKAALAARNILGSLVVSVDAINVYDLVNANYLVCPKESIGMIEKKILGEGI